MKKDMEVVIREDNKVTGDLEVKCYEVDANKVLKPTAFMDMAQEMAYQAAGAMHFGYDELISQGMAWVLARMHFRFVDPPRWNDRVSIQTWHRGPAGPFFIRDFKLTSGERALVECTSSWVVMDVSTRRMARPEDILPTEGTVCHDAAIQAPSSKVMMPRGVESFPAGVHKVAYSDIDLIGHTNNARYLAWAMDCLDYPTGGITVRDVEITFHHEARANESVTLRKAVVEEDGPSGNGSTAFIEGRTDEAQVFCARISYLVASSTPRR